MTTAKYYAANKKKIAERNAAYRGAHKEEYAAYSAKHEAKPETKAKRAAYREAHRDEAYERTKAWLKAHPEGRKANRNRRRARERGAEGTHTGADIEAIYQEQGGCCFWCGKDVGADYHVDHFYPLSRGGSNWPENLVVSCPSCNISKNDKLPSEYLGSHNEIV